ncbi:MAG: Hpt domain-containing protein, partial [Deltaproteobacteria bacterium]|nr:Hpt domain-containing protein [Deltaproteobacteria bacterium]
EPQVPGKAEPQAPEQAEPQVPGQAEPQAPEQASGSPDVGLSGSGPFRSPRNPPRFRDGGFDPEASLAQLAGDHELMEEVLEMYIQSTPALLDTLRGIDSANVADFAKTFHSLKGSSLNVGARKVGEMAASLEKAAKEGDSETVMATFADFIETAEGLIFQMTSYLKHISPER